MSNPPRRTTLRRQGRYTIDQWPGHVRYSSARVVGAVAALFLLLSAPASAVLPAAANRVLRATQAETIPDYNWYPGYYVLNNIDTAARKQAILDDPLVQPFTGVQFRYHWAASELSPGDYSAGFATLDADLARVAASGKKILVMLMYKESDGTSAVPADLRTGPGPWCTGPYCGELTNGSGTSVAMLWNQAVEARLNAWITAMAEHLSESPYLANVAGIVFNETALGTTDTTVLASAGYDPNVYIQALEDNMLAATTAAPRLVTLLYFEGGFVSMDGTSVKAGQKIGDWMLLHPRTGTGTPDATPKSPKGTNHPCANSKYQSSIACAPAVQANDYSTQVTDSFEQTFQYGTAPVPDGLHGSFFTFSYAVGVGPNAFTFADVSSNIPSHPIPNTARPWPVGPAAGPPVANDDSASTSEGTTVTIDVAANDTDPDGDLDRASANTACSTCTTPTDGALVNDGNGSFEYTPNSGFSGTDGFVYEICDSRGACDTAAVTVGVGGNHAPQITSSGGADTASISVDENVIAVATVTATDPDVPPDPPLDFSITGGADRLAFAIVPTTGDLAFVSAPNYELPTDVGADNVYDVTVSVSDGKGGSDSQAIAVTVVNVNEFAPVITSDGGGDSAALSRPENQTAVTDVDASDADLQTPTYSISGGPDAARFAIVPATGVLSFVTAPNFEAPGDVGSNNVYDLTVQASDGTLTDTQAIAVTVTDVAEAAGSPLYFSLLGGGTVGGVSAADEDIVYFDGTSFSLAFQGSDVGLGPLRIDAFSWVDATTLLLSFDQPGTVPGIAGTVDDSDVVRFTATSLGSTTAGTFSLYLDGSDVGLSTSAEDVDAIELLPNGHLLLSTTGSFAVPGVSGEDEDLLDFSPTQLGTVTAGTFSLSFDGSDVGLTASSEDVDAVAVDGAGRIYVSTTGNFAVTGVSGADEDVFVFTQTSPEPSTAGTFSPTLYFDGSAYGLAANDVFAIDLP